MIKQQAIAFETIPAKAWRASDLIAPENATGNPFVDVLRNTLDNNLLKAHFKNDKVVKADVDDVDHHRKHSIL